MASLITFCAWWCFMLWLFCFFVFCFGIYAQFEVVFEKLSACELTVEERLQIIKRHYKTTMIYFCEEFALPMELSQLIVQQYLPEPHNFINLCPSNENNLWFETQFYCYAQMVLQIVKFLLLCMLGVSILLIPLLGFEIVAFLDLLMSQKGMIYTDGICSADFNTFFEFCCPVYVLIWLTFGWKKANHESFCKEYSRVQEVVQALGNNCMNVNYKHLPKLFYTCEAIFWGHMYHIYSVLMVTWFWLYCIITEKYTITSIWTENWWNFGSTCFAYNFLPIICAVSFYQWMWNAHESSCTKASRLTMRQLMLNRLNINWLGVHLQLYFCVGTVMMAVAFFL
ncbi:hypothetical protein RFI_07003 [Reticulomyxa filosa]|uniref:Uncharacterized protein n=1 Tax=Reticulomyxa filosa TaxID=46433 RepID=X6NUY5_RETFI|nr:hypothetical protein RFI_07003 [Reticulomyxa filosa]|eukprot:ETO30120.1 hypothetical protein RFI_07003 [Reticulomyxa filosa]